MAGTRDVRPRKPGGRRNPTPGEELLVTRPGSPLWHYSFTLRGHRLRGSCGTADFALAAAYAKREHDAAFRRIALGEKPPADLTLNEAAVAWWEDRGQHSRYGVNGQRHQFARMIRILGGETRLADLDNGTVARLVRGLRAGEGVNEGKEARGEATPATVNRYLASLSVLCSYAREVHGAEVGPWSKKPHLLQEENEGRERFLTPEQVRQLAELIIPHARVPITLAVACGARKDNWLHCTWEQVSLDMGRLLVIGKRGKPLGVTLPPLAVRLLAWLEPDPAARQGAVFRFGSPRVGCTCSQCVSRPGQPILDIKRSWKTAVRNAGLPADTRLHDLRHSFASWLLASTGDLRLVQEALHHTEITTTTRYARLLPGRREQGIAAATAALEAVPVAPAKKEAG